MRYFLMSSVHPPRTLHWQDVVYNSRHAYVQFANAEDVDEFAGKPVKLKDHYYKTFKLKSIPTVQELIEAIGL